MISVFLEKENIKGDIVEVRDKKDINHLKNSFRLKVGDEIRVVDGEFEYLCKVTNLEKKSILCEILEKKEDTYSPNVNVDIAIGLIKNDKMDLVITKLTELGINRITPMITDRTIVKVKEKKDKWDISMREALKQCQGVKEVKIENPTKLEELKFSDYDLIFVPYESMENTKIIDFRKEIVEAKNILYIIGPEGGFSEKEIESLVERKAKIVTLGKRILRAETAAIVAGGVILNEVW